MFATEFLDIPPLDSAAGTVALPGSKSISNRVLLLAALCEGTTVVHDLLDSDDTRVMLDALRALGCGVAQDGAAVRVTGFGRRGPAPRARLFLGNAGTAMRPLAAALAVLGGDYELSGVPRMHERPIGDLVDALRQLGCDIEYLGQDGFPPLRLSRPALRLDAPIRIRGDVSSQFLTALLLALPLVSHGAPTPGTGVSGLPPEGAAPPRGGPSAGQDVVIEVTGELISRPYVEITLALLARFGVAVRRDGWQRFTIPAGSRYSSPGELHVEADASSASYFVAAGALASDSGVRILGVGRDSIQGDIRFLDAAQAMGAKVASGPNWIEVSRGVWPLKAIDLDCNHIPDAAMTLAVMALYADGPSTLRNIASWRVKETDRLAAMSAELRKLGAQVEEGSDSLRVTPPGFAAAPSQGEAAPSGGSEPHEVGSVGAVSAWRAARIRTYDDHRMAMCFSLAAFNPAGAHVRIDDPKCVAKTFPDYFETLFSIARLPVPCIPVICIDGPTASGKGTLASRTAQRLGYHYLDSGALYRLTALAAVRAGLPLDEAHEHSIAAMAEKLPVQFDGLKVLLGGEDVTEAIRVEEVGMDASRVSSLPAVRTGLVALQQGFRQLPGLVADGRDMGTVIFPDAQLKVFLTASAAKRAERRHKQLISKGFAPTIDTLRADLEARDERDSKRAVAPLKPAQDALLLDNSEQSVDDSVARVLAWWEARQPFAVS